MVKLVRCLGQKLSDERGCIVSNNVCLSAHLSDITEAVHDSWPPCVSLEVPVDQASILTRTLCLTGSS